MNLEFEKGQTVKMVSHDNMVVEGAIGVIESTTDVTADIHPVQIPKNQMGIAVKELKAKYPAADGKKIADLVKANLCN